MNNNYYEICKFSCAFYKPVRKTEQHCFSFEKIVEFLKTDKLEIRKILKINIQSFKNKNDKLLLDTICEKCPFVKDGCDFRAGKGNEPCGGYKIIDILLSDIIIHKGLLTEKND